MTIDAMLQIKRCGHSAVVRDNIFALEGFSETEELSSAEVYSSGTKHFDAMNRARFCSGCCVMGEKIFVSGEFFDESRVTES